MKRHWTVHKLSQNLISMSDNGLCLIQSAAMQYCIRYSDNLQARQPGFHRWTSMSCHPHMLSSHASCCFLSQHQGFHDSELQVCRSRWSGRPIRF